MFSLTDQLTRAEGRTPEFVRWSIGFRCSIRRPIVGADPRANERYLGPLAAIGRCIAAGQVIDGVCIVPPTVEGEFSRGCFVEEIANFYGGIDACTTECGRCSANIGGLPETNRSASTKSLAGCFGWLVRNESMVERLESEVEAIRGEFPSSDFPRKTHPAWYGLWSIDKLEGSPLELVRRVFAKLVGRGNAPHDWLRFEQVLRQCGEQKWPLSIQLVPAGKAERIDWWIGPYCPDCRAPHDGSDGIQKCPVCGRRGRAHPAIRRKVVGWRPFVKLDSLIGPENARRLLGRLSRRDQVSEPSSKWTKGPD